MNLKCPHCNTTFEVVESHYAALLAQVRTVEFEAELQRRLGEIAEMHKAEEQNRRLMAEKKMAENLSAKEREISALGQEIERLKGMIENHDAVKRAELAGVETENARRMSRIAAEKDKEIADLRSRLQVQDSRHELDLAKERNLSKDALHRKEQEITQLTSRLEAGELASEKRELEIKEQYK
ncbi:MAG: hypothetical protein K2G59_03720, partial [Muribaculaceae bacterium]|nr:hypothetical protein [Muribaculaceae bacterium]